MGSSSSRGLLRDYELRMELFEALVHMVHSTTQINGSGSRYFTVVSSVGCKSATRAGPRTITAALATPATVAAGEAVVTAAVFCLLLV